MSLLMTILSFFLRDRTSICGILRGFASACNSLHDPPWPSTVRHTSRTPGESRPARYLRIAVKWRCHRHFLQFTLRAEFLESSKPDRPKGAFCDDFLAFG